MLLTKRTGGCAAPVSHQVSPNVSEDLEVSLVVSGTYLGPVEKLARELSAKATCAGSSSVPLTEHTAIATAPLLEQLSKLPTASNDDRTKKKNEKSGFLYSCIICCNSVSVGKQAPLLQCVRPITLRYHVMFVYICNYLA